MQCEQGVGHSLTQTKYERLLNSLCTSQGLFRPVSRGWCPAFLTLDKRTNGCVRLPRNSWLRPVSTPGVKSRDFNNHPSHFEYAQHDCEQHTHFDIILHIVATGAILTSVKFSKHKFGSRIKVAAPKNKPRKILNDTETFRCTFLQTAEPATMNMQTGFFWGFFYFLFSNRGDPPGQS